MRQTSPTWFAMGLKATSVQANLFENYYQVESLDFLSPLLFYQFNPKPMHSLKLIFQLNNNIHRWIKYIFYSSHGSHRITGPRGLPLFIRNHIAWRPLNYIVGFDGSNKASTIYFFFSTYLRKNCTLQTIKYAGHRWFDRTQIFAWFQSEQGLTAGPTSVNTVQTSRTWWRLFIQVRYMAWI